MAFMLDISKTYDRVEWQFLEKVTIHLGFSSNIVCTIMTCIKFISYIVLSLQMIVFFFVRQRRQNVKLF